MEKAFFTFFLLATLTKSLFSTLSTVCHTPYSPHHFSLFPPSAALLHRQKSDSGAKPGFFTFRLLRLLPLQKQSVL